MIVYNEQKHYFNNITVHKLLQYIDSASRQLSPQAATVYWLCKPPA